MSPRDTHYPYPLRVALTLFSSRSIFRIMGTKDYDLARGIVKCDAATYFEWREQLTALLAGLSLGQYVFNNEMSTSTSSLLQ